MSMPRTLNPDGSIQTGCATCGGTKFITNHPYPGSKVCSDCNGTGAIVVAPAGSQVTVSK